MTKRNTKQAMSVTEFRATLKRLGWTYHDAAEQLGKSFSSVAKYGAGAHIPTPIAKLLRLLSQTKPEPPTFALSISTANDAFEGDWLSTELARILRTLASRIEHDGFTTAYDGKLRDINGNFVGEFSYID
jgi:transcriptional regulator with XRE-family HTH domain